MLETVPRRREMEANYIKMLVSCGFIQRWSAFQQHVIVCPWKAMKNRVLIRCEQGNHQVLVAQLRHVLVNEDWDHHPTSSVYYNQAASFPQDECVKRFYGWEESDSLWTCSWISDGHRAALRYQQGGGVIMVWAGIIIKDELVAPFRLLPVFRKHFLQTVVQENVCMFQEDRGFSAEWCSIPSVEVLHCVWASKGLTDGVVLQFFIIN